MAWQKPTDPFCTDITGIWVFFTDEESWAHHQGPQRPCSELSRSCLNGILIVSCFCGVVLLFVFPPECLLSPPTRMPLLTFIPLLSNQVRLFPHQSPQRKVTFGTICDGGQRDVNRRVSAVNKKPGR